MMQGQSWIVARAGAADVSGSLAPLTLYCCPIDAAAAEATRATCAPWQRIRIVGTAGSGHRLSVSSKSTRAACMKCGTQSALDAARAR